jgi:hypothetical protein
MLFVNLAPVDWEASRPGIALSLLDKSPVRIASPMLMPIVPPSVRTRPKVAVEVAISESGMDAWRAMRGGWKRHPMPIPLTKSQISCFALYNICKLMPDPFRGNTHTLVS